MERKEKITNVYLWTLLPCALAAVAWAILRFPVEKVSVGLLALGFVTIFLSSYLRIQLPRTKIHLTVSDALIFLSMLLYGGSVAIILATLETAYASWSLQRKGVPMKAKTILINVLIAAISIFATYMAISLAFGPAEEIVAEAGSSAFIWLLALAALCQFLVNSVCVSAFISIRTGSRLLHVWNEHCFNALVMYLSGAAMAGIGAKAIQQTNVTLFAAVIAFISIVYLTYRRYVDDIHATSAQAEDAERRRAEQAEKYVKELRHYVGELEKSSQALQESREKFRHAAYHDAMTELPNRNYFLEILRSLIGRADGSDSKFAVMFLDLNRFKTINDSLGHSAGDQLIREVGARLTKAVGENNLVSRFSGDEFAILLSRTDGVRSVTDLADKVAAEIAKPFTIRERRVFTSVSIGIAFDNSKYVQGEEILRDADIAMYYAKGDKKNYVIFDARMHARAVSLMELETDLRYAIENDQLELYYQPIIDLDHLTISGFEALVRWNHPTRGLVSPNEFIGVAEATGLVVPMTIDLLQKACAQLVYWHLRSPAYEHLTVNVNVSGKHFAEGGLAKHVKSILEKTGLDPSYLKLEITESAVMEDAELAIAILKEIKSTGVRLSIDDFGTGYSSLSYLHRFPIDTLKVDRSFVSAMEDGSENGEIVRTVIALAKALNLSVVAEGIENIHQLHQLRILQCEYGQGYLFSRPLRVDKVEQLLESRHSWQSEIPAADVLIFPEDGIYPNQYIS